MIQIIHQYVQIVLFHPPRKYNCSQTFGNDCLVRFPHRDIHTPFQNILSLSEASALDSYYFPSTALLSDRNRDNISSSVLFLFPRPLQIRRQNVIFHNHLVAKKILPCYLTYAFFPLYKSKHISAYIYHSTAFSFRQFYFLLLSILIFICSIKLHSSIDSYDYGKYYDHYIT